MAVTVEYDRTTVGVHGFQTNTYEAGDQLTPDVLGLSGGGFVSAYVTDAHVRLNFYGADHAVIGSHVIPHQNPSDAAGQPKLAELAGGNVVVVWDENDTADADAGPHAAIFTPAGNAVALDVDLLGLNATGHAEVDVAALANGGFVLTYALGGDIFFNLFDASGVEQAGPFAVNTATAGTQADAQVTVLSDGAFAVTWTDTNLADQPIMGRIFEANGAARTTPEFVASQQAGGDSTRSSIAALHDGGFAVVCRDTAWDEIGLDEDPGITLRIVSAAGVAGPPIHVNDDHFREDTDPDVTVLANGYIMVTWNKPDDPDDGDIAGRIFTEAGVPVTDDSLIAASAPDQVAPAVSALPGGMFITSWQDETTDGAGGSISSAITLLTRRVQGDAAADAYAGDELIDSMHGAGGDDTLEGAGGDDTLHGAEGIDILSGGGGHDLLQGGENSDSIFGGAGNDRIYGADRADPHTSLDGDYLSGEAGVDRIRGAGGDDVLLGGAQGDKINGGAGNDLIDGQEDLDKLKGSAGDDTIYGGYNVDTINGGVGDDLLYAKDAVDPDGSGDGDRMNGANGHDTMVGAGSGDEMFGLAGKDVMSGRGGLDTLAGGSGKDILIGGGGADRLTGGGDKDTFRFVDVSDSANGAEDLITDLGNLDVIDLSGIDARPSSPTDQAFTLVAAFTGEKGELVVTYHATGTYADLTTIQGDVDGDALADFTITVAGDRHNYANFVL